MRSRCAGSTCRPSSWSTRASRRRSPRISSKRRSLGVEGATIFYRRRVQDMPIAFPKDNTPEQIKRTELVREKMVKILAEKYLLRVKDCHIPVRR